MPNAGLLKDVLDWRGRAAIVAACAPDAVVPGDAVETLCRRAPLHPWGIFECVGEAAFTKYGGDLVRMCRAFKGWACSEEDATNDVRQLAAVLKNAQLIRQLRRTGLGIEELAEIFKAPEQTMRKLASPWVIGMQDCPQDLIPWGGARRTDGASSPTASYAMPESPVSREPSVDGRTLSPTRARAAAVDAAPRGTHSEHTTDDGLTSTTTGNSPTRDSRQSLCSSDSSDARAPSDAEKDRPAVPCPTVLDVRKQQVQRRGSYNPPTPTTSARHLSARRASAPTHLTNASPDKDDESPTPTAAKRKTRKPLTLTTGLYWTALPESVLHELEQQHIPFRRSSAAGRLSPTGPAHSTSPARRSPRRAEVPARVSDLSPRGGVRGRRDSGQWRPAGRSLTPSPHDKLTVEDEGRSSHSARHLPPRRVFDDSPQQAPARRFRGGYEMEGATPSPHVMQRNPSFSKGSAKRRGTAPDLSFLERRQTSPSYAQHTQSTRTKVAPLDLGSRRMSTGRIPTAAVATARVPSTSQPMLTNRRSSATPRPFALPLSRQKVGVSESPVRTPAASTAFSRSRSGAGSTTGTSASRTKSPQSQRRNSRPAPVAASPPAAAPTTKPIKRGVPAAKAAAPSVFLTVPNAATAGRRGSGKGRSGSSRNSHTTPAPTQAQPSAVDSTEHAPLEAPKATPVEEEAPQPEPEAAVAETDAPAESEAADVQPVAEEAPPAPQPEPVVEEAAEETVAVEAAPEAVHEPALEPVADAATAAEVHAAVQNDLDGLDDATWKPAAAGGRPPTSMPLPEFLMDTNEKDTWTVADAARLLGRERTPSVEPSVTDVVSPSVASPVPASEQAVSPCMVSPTEADGERDLELSPPSCPSAPRQSVPRDDDMDLVSPEVASPEVEPQPRLMEVPPAEFPVTRDVSQPSALSSEEPVREGEATADEDLSPGRKLEASFARFLASTKSIRSDCERKLEASLSSSQGMSLGPRRTSAPPALFAQAQRDEEAEAATPTLSNSRRVGLARRNSSPAPLHSTTTPTAP